MAKKKTPGGPTALSKRKATQKAAHQKAQAQAKLNGTKAAPSKPGPSPGQLFETQKITPKVKRLANRYRDASVDKSQAVGKFNGIRDELIEAMNEDGIHRVLIELGGTRKAVTLEEKDVIKLETVKDETPAAGS